MKFEKGTQSAHIEEDTIWAEVNPDNMKYENN
jgi:hypothetical protein